MCVRAAFGDGVVHPTPLLLSEFFLLRITNGYLTSEDTFLKEWWRIEERSERVRCVKMDCRASQWHSSAGVLSLRSNTPKRTIEAHTQVHTLSRCKNPPRTTQLRPMAVRVVHKLQRYTLSVARLTAPKPHTGGAVRLANPHAKQVVAQCRAVRSVVPRPRRRAHCRAPPVTRRMQRPLVVQKQPLEGRTNLTLPPHSLYLVPALRSTSAACVHGALSRVPTQRSTPDAGANARSQPAL